MAKQTQVRSFKFYPEDVTLLNQLAKSLRVPQTQVLRLALRGYSLSNRNVMVTASRLEHKEEDDPYDGKNDETFDIGI